MADLEEGEVHEVMEDEFFQTESPKPSPLPWILFVAALLGGGMGIFLAYKELSAERSSAQAVALAAEETNAKLADTEAGKKALEGRLEAADEEATRLRRDRDMLAAQIMQKEDEIAALKATYDSLEDQMKAEINTGEIRLSQAGDRIQVDLVDKILFDSGQADLSVGGREVLARLASVLAKVDDKIIQVSGHTDASPIADKKLAERFPTNWELSVSRAVNVVRYLTETGGVPSKRLMAAGYGQNQPVASNATPQGRARNRRIEILLTPALDAKQAQLTLAKEPPKTAKAGKAPAKVKKKGKRSRR
jgi:chemotaxis protein MotB